MAKFTQKEEQLLAILLNIKATLETDQGRELNQWGLCAHVGKYNNRTWRTGSMYFSSRDLISAMKKIWTNWEHYSGERDYPVTTVDNIDPMSQYYNTSFKWSQDTSYGRRRRELLDYLINTLTERQMKHDKSTCNEQAADKEDDILVSDLSNTKS